MLRQTCDKTLPSIRDIKNKSKVEVFYGEAARGQAGGYNQMEVITNVVWEWDGEFTDTH